jgi:hypothetical protein
MREFASKAGAAALAAEKAKLRKYGQVAGEGVEFAPLAFETLGRWGESAVKLLRRIASVAVEQRGWSRGVFIRRARQELSVALQRGNAVCAWRGRQRLVNLCGLRALRAPAEADGEL